MAGVDVTQNVDAFNAAFAACPVVRYWYDGTVHSVYVRTSAIPTDFDAHSLFTGPCTGFAREVVNGYIKV